MKAIKYFLVVALMTVIGAPAMAQDMTLEQALKVVKDNSKTLKEKEQALKAAKFNKKDVKQDCDVAYTFLTAADTASARKYAQFALKAGKSQAEPYILLGDIEAYCDNPGPAASWYEQAIYFDPNNEKGYIKYAAVNSYSSPSMAVAKLEELKRIRPDYPVDAEAAHIYYNVGVNKGKTSMFTDALNYYKKCDLAKLKNDRLTEYALIALLTGDYQTCLNVSEFGLKADPKKAGLNRMALYSETELKNYPQAVAYIDKLLASDSVKVSLNDYKYAANALQGNKQYKEAISYWEKVINEAGDKESDKLTAMKSISDCYNGMGDTEKSLEALKAYLAANPNATYNDYIDLANIYKNKGSEQKGAEQAASFQEAIKVYETMAEKFSTKYSVVEYAEFLAARLASALDPTSEKGVAKPYYEKVAQSIEARGGNTDADKTRLVEAYRYLGYYSFLQKDMASAKSYFEKILTIDPENAQAKQFMDAIK